MLLLPLALIALLLLIEPPKQALREFIDDSTMQRPRPAAARRSAASASAAPSSEAPPPTAPPSTAPPPTAPPPPAVPRTLSKLKREYERKMSKYRQLIDTAVGQGDTSTMDQIRQLNVDLASLLEQMLSASALTRRDAKELDRVRDELVDRLRRIQLDYNGLLQTTDELETLRRIRAQESDGFLRVFYWHLIFLAIAFFGVLAGMIFLKGGDQSREATNATTASPAISPALM